jgi:hypothetical protein
MVKPYPAHNLWSCSLKHHHFCAMVPHTSNEGQFLIPYVKTLLSVIGRYPIEEFLIASKLSEKISQA